MSFAAVLNQKNEFFDQREWTFKNCRDLASGKGYQYSYDYLALLAQELDDMMHSLKLRKTYPKEFYYYCYFLAYLLEQHHITYGQQSRAEKFKKIRKKIVRHVNHKPEEKIKPQSFVRYLLDQAKATIDDLRQTPRQLSSTRDKLMLSNLMRIYWVFTRLSLEQFLKIASDKNWLENMEKVLRHHVDVDKTIKVLEMPTSLLNIASVGLFLSRAIYNLIMIGKHVLAPNEKEKLIPWQNRLMSELKKRHVEFINDFVWAAVNGLTNFKFVTFIPGPAKMWLLAGFLYFDFAVILYARFLAKKEYDAKRQQYGREYEDLLALLNSMDINDPKRKITEYRFQMVCDQIEQLNISWSVKNATLVFLAAAALILAMGFTASLLVQPGIMVLACYCVILVGIGMYLSKSAFANWWEKEKRLELVKHQHQDLTLANKEAWAARGHLAFTVIKNTVMPGLIISAFVFCWPAGIALTVLYAGYELFHHFASHRHQETVKKIENQSIEQSAMVLS